MSTKKKIGVIIYARSSSKRLPNKILLNIKKNKSLLELVYERIRLGSKKIPIIINTSLSSNDNKIINFCKKKKISYFRGSLNNVFDRTIKCCAHYNISTFVRVCADRPFFDYNLMKKMIRVHKGDISTNQLPRLSPKGLSCEIANINIFKQINQKKLSRKQKEHIFNYFYLNKKKFKINSIYCNFSQKYLKKNFSIDTKKQFFLIKKIFKKKLINSKDSTVKILKKINNLF